MPEFHLLVGWVFVLSSMLSQNFGSPRHLSLEVQEVSLNLYSGQIFCLLGHNGAGGCRKSECEKVQVDALVSASYRGEMVKGCQGA